MEPINDAMKMVDAKNEDENGDEDSPAKLWANTR
jgi:hypothetical protein